MSGAHIKADCGCSCPARPVESHFELDTCHRGASSPSISGTNDCGARITRRMRTGEMDGANEPSSQGVSSRVPVDHRRCQ